MLCRCSYAATNDWSGLQYRKVRQILSSKNARNTIFLIVWKGKISFSSSYFIHKSVILSGEKHLITDKTILTLNRQVTRLTIWGGHSLEERTQFSFNLIESPESLRATWPPGLLWSRTPAGSAPGWTVPSRATPAGPSSSGRGRWRWRPDRGCTRQLWWPSTACTWSQPADHNCGRMTKADLALECPQSPERWSLKKDVAECVSLTRRL